MPVGNLVTINFSAAHGGSQRTWDVPNTTINAVILLLDGGASGVDVTAATYPFLGQVDSDGSVNDTINTGGAN